MLLFQSHTPVEFAVTVQRVVLHLNRGAMVSVLTPVQVQEIFEIRSALEVKAIQLAIPKLQESDLTKFALMLELGDKTTDAKMLTKLNWEFHAALYNVAERPLLLKMIQNLHINCDRYIRLQMEGKDYRESSQKEHNQILVACQQRDIKAAIKLLKKTY